MFMQIPDYLFKKLERMSTEVKDDLRRKGIVIPIENDDGSIGLGTFKVVKTAEGFFNVLDYSDEIVVDKINLAQSAILIANNLALGKFLDFKILQADRSYGFALFEELLHKKSMSAKKRSVDKIELKNTKFQIAKAKKESHKQCIVKSFEKLRKFV